MKTGGKSASDYHAQPGNPAFTPGWQTAGMVLLVMLLLTVPALAQPADCPAVPVGPPMDVVVGVAPAGQAAKPGQVRIGGWLSLSGLPSLGTTCQAPPPPAVDVLHGPPAPHGLLRGDGPADVLHGASVRTAPP
jgi:hypothetical protein